MAFNMRQLVTGMLDGTKDTRDRVSSPDLPSEESTPFTSGLLSKYPALSEAVNKTTSKTVAVPEESVSESSSLTVENQGFNNLLDKMSSSNPEAEQAIDSYRQKLLNEKSNPRSYRSEGSTYYEKDTPYTSLLRQHVEPLQNLNPLEYQFYKDRGYVE